MRAAAEQRRKDGVSCNSEPERSRYLLWGGIDLEIHPAMAIDLCIRTLRS